MQEKDSDGLSWLNRETFQEKCTPLPSGHFGFHHQEMEERHRRDITTTELNPIRRYINLQCLCHSPVTTHLQFRSSEMTNSLNQQTNKRSGFLLLSLPGHNNSTIAIQATHLEGVKKYIETSQRMMVTISSYSVLQ